MRKALLFLYIIAFCLSCSKNDKPKPTEACDIEKTRADNASKATITNGIWGTLSHLTGDCMPLGGPGQNNPCSHCPVKRTIRIYEYTTPSQATPSNVYGLYDSFSTRLLKEFSSDNNGFYQVEIAPGTYTVVALNSGKMYAFGVDGQGGIGAVTISGGKQNINLMITNAVF